MQHKPFSQHLKEAMDKQASIATRPQPAPVQIGPLYVGPYIAPLHIGRPV